MSSFVISKKEYVKAAGFIAGIAHSFSIGIHEFWVWDFKEGKNTDKDLYYKRFVQCFEMNAKSVQEQYRDDSPETDSKKYTAEFNEYYRKGSALMAQSREYQLQAVSNIQGFMHSSLYQIENERYSFMVRHWYNTIIDELLNKVVLSGFDSENWGSFEVPENGRDLQIIA